MKLTQKPVVTHIIWYQIKTGFDTENYFPDLEFDFPKFSGQANRNN